MGIESYKRTGDWYKNRFTRGVFFLVGDTLALTCSAIASYLILLPFISPDKPFPIEHAAIVIGSVLLGLAVFRMYLIKWRYVGLRDLVRIILGITMGGAFSLGISQLFMQIGKYEGAFTALFLINAVIFVGGFRISKRLYYGMLNASRNKKSHAIFSGVKARESRFCEIF